MDDHRNDERQRCKREAYAAWLASRNVRHASRLVETTDKGVVAGWGCVALADIEEGTELFSVPRGACFGADARGDGDDGEEDGENEHENDGENEHENEKDGSGGRGGGRGRDFDPTTSDTQKPLALQIMMHCRRRAPSGGGWAPFLDMLTPHPLPWTYPTSFRRRMLKGTELEGVAERKVRRLREEHEEVQDVKGMRDATFAEYVDACAAAASHANPWFGVSIVPFNATLNWGPRPNVEFDLVHQNGEERIVGRAIGNIAQGEELFQPYGDSAAEVFYRCGFVPTEELEGDAVSISVEDLLVVLEGCVGKGAMSDVEAKLAALQRSGAMDVSSWDGIDGLTAELSRPSEAFVSQMEGTQTNQDGEDEGDVGDDGGASKLVGIFLVLLAGEEAWRRASAAVQGVGADEAGRADADKADDEEEEEEESDDGSRTDDRTASALLSSLADLSPSQSSELERLALTVGRGGRDPWRALLLAAARFESERRDGRGDAKRLKTDDGTSASSSPGSVRWASVFEAAKSAIDRRLQKADEGDASRNELLAALGRKPGARTGEGATGSGVEEARRSDDEMREAVRAAAALQEVERQILRRAAEILEATTREVLAISAGQI